MAAAQEQPQAQAQAERLATVDPGPPVLARASNTTASRREPTSTSSLTLEPLKALPSSTSSSPSLSPLPSHGNSQGRIDKTPGEYAERAAAEAVARDDANPPPALPNGSSIVGSTTAAATAYAAIVPEPGQEQVGEQISQHNPTLTLQSNAAPSTTTPQNPSATAAISAVPADPSIIASSSLVTSSAEGPDAVGEPQRNGSLTTTPLAMSHPPPHPSGPPRPPSGYPTTTAYTNPPTAYAPPVMNTHYGYPGALPGADLYRGSPTIGSSAMSLPSMRTFDAVQQAQQQPPPPQPHMAMGAPMPSMAGNMAYYGQPVPMPGYGMPHDAMARYALPPNDPRAVLANSRHKKEIKRRTKTGCLTCRKRRIKCDEQHPVCKNCQKSKRECLGYDPIFKQQQQHQTNIQPAPNHPAAASSVPSNGPAQVTPTLPSNAASYSPQSVVSGSYTTTPSSITSSSFHSGLKSHPVTVSEFPAIDPALDNVGATPTMSVSHFPPGTHESPHSMVEQKPPELHLRGGGPSYYPYHEPAPQFTPSPQLQQQQTPAYSPYSSARKMRVNELIALGKAVPQNPELPITQETLQDIRAVYVEIYGPGLESFFESKWFTSDITVNSLLNNEAARRVVASFLERMTKMNNNDVAAISYTANLEFNVVWDLACLAFSNAAMINNSHILPAEDDAVEVRNRVFVFEKLLVGDYLDQNPLMAPPSMGDYHRLREFEFWYQLAEFLRIRDDGSAHVAAYKEEILRKLRTVLDGRENRDVLYSLAVIRALSPNYPPDFESTLPPHLDESDPKSKLAVARKFIQDESQVTGGTTNVVRRFSELAFRAFISPGNNVARNTSLST